MPAPPLVVAVSLTLLAGACSPGAAPPQAGVEGAARADTTLPGALRTAPVDASPIRIRASDLPAPYASESASRSPDVVAAPPDPVLRVPPGFAVQLWADGLSDPRWLAVAPDGAVILAESRGHRLRRLRDTDGDGVADRVGVLARRTDGLSLPMGLAFGDAAADGSADLFVGNTDEVVRFRYRPDRPLEGPPERLAELPGGGYNQHWTRNVVRHGDSLYVTVGSRSNVDPEELPRASVFRIGLDGSGRETVSFGLRNPVGLAFQPETGAPYTTVNERDRLGDDLVPDYLARIGFEAGGEPMFFGWPYAYLTPDRLDPRRTRRDGRSERPDLAARTRTPDVLFQAHSAALGLAFYPADVSGLAAVGTSASGPPGRAFPPRYRGGAFVAMRGSWNRSAGTGYKIAFVPFEDGRPVGHYQDFVTGFLLDPGGPTVWGRPVGVLVLPDGSLLFTDEPGGRIFRVSWAG